MNRGKITSPYHGIPLERLSSDVSMSAKTLVESDDPRDMGIPASYFMRCVSGLLTPSVFGEVMDPGLDEECFERLPERSHKSLVELAISAHHSLAQLDMLTEFGLSEEAKVDFDNIRTVIISSSIALGMLDIPGAEVRDFMLDIETRIALGEIDPTKTLVPRIYGPNDMQLAAVRKLISTTGEEFGSIAAGMEFAVPFGSDQQRTVRYSYVAATVGSEWSNPDYEEPPNLSYYGLL